MKQTFIAHRCWTFSNKKQKRDKAKPDTA